jgi:GAF domain-containing protein
VIGGDELLGLIYMYKTDPQEPPFDQKDFQLAVAISHQAALTIQRMKLLERFQEEQRLRQLLQRFVSPARRSSFRIILHLESCPNWRSIH